MVDASGKTFAVSRPKVSKGLLTVLVATVALFALSVVVAPSAVSGGALLGMLPFASVLAIVGLGQMLVVQQGGIDLSVPGAVSLALVIASHQPGGNDGRLPGAIVLAIALAIVAGLLNGLLVGFLRLNAIIATLGTNALLFGAVLGISGGRPVTVTDNLASMAGGLTLGVPNSVYFAIALLLIVSFFVKRTVGGRRFEAVGASPAAARVAGLRVRAHGSLAYVWAQILYAIAGILLAGITVQPSAFQGNEYLLPSVAVVVLGGTSLLGGRGFPASTVIAALFLSQLDQFVLALGVPFAVRTLVEAAALAVGVAIYTVNWRAVRAKLDSLRAHAPVAS